MIRGRIGESAFFARFIVGFSRNSTFWRGRTFGQVTPFGDWASAAPSIRGN
jgi:hypothetical protein